MTWMVISFAKGIVLEGKMKVTDALRKCTRCLQVKVASKDFYLNNGLPRHFCKKCFCDLSKIYNKLHPGKGKRDLEAKRKYMKKYYQDKKEVFAANRKRFYENNPGYALAYATAYRLKKREEKAKEREQA